MANLCLFLKSFPDHRLEMNSQIVTLSSKALKEITVKRLSRTKPCNIETFCWKVLFFFYHVDSFEKLHI